MSLIYDALRKAQGELQNPTDTQVEKNPSAEQTINGQTTQERDISDNPKVKQVNPNKTHKFLYVILAFLVLVFLIKYNFSVIKQKLFPKKDIRAEKIVEKFIPSPGPSFKEGLFLSGIVMGQTPDENIAIINDMIVTKGDMIDGATILDISALEVEMKKDGETLILELE